MRSLAACTFTGTVAAASLTNWESHGEVTDEFFLSQPAISDELIAEVNGNPVSTWVAGRNPRFENATLRDAKALMGMLQNTNASSFLPYKAQGSLVELPDDFDWREDSRASACPSVREIRDQANCGSCWAFGAVEAMTDRICLASGGAKQDHLSAQDVTSCLHGSMDDGCEGGVSSDAYDYYKKTGIVTGGNYGDKSMCYSYQLATCAHHMSGSKYPDCPPSADTPQCANKCMDNGASWASSKRYGMGGYSVCTQDPDAPSCPDAMMQEIYQKGPLSGGFLVKKSFMAYKSGVFNPPAGESMVGGHAIKILGWGTEDGTPYWLCANSWNEEWGMDGFFKIIRGTNEGWIESPYMNGGPTAGMPKLSEDVEV